jgi:membrane protease YdiL (CAAX protease family)
VENTSTWAPSPNSPTPLANEPKGFGVWFSALVLLGTICTVFAAQFIAAAILYARGFQIRDAQHLAPAAQLLFASAGDAAVTLYLLAVLPSLAKRSLASLGIRTPTPREIGIGLAGGLAMAVLTNPLAGALQSLTHATHPEAALALLKGLHEPWQIAAFALLACVLAPITEELVFRAFIFNAIARYGGFWPAALVSSIIFGLVHVSSSALDIVVFALPLAIGGIVLAYVYSRSTCYWSNVISHSFFNSISVVAILVFHVKA